MSIIWEMPVVCLRTVSASQRISVTEKHFSARIGTAYFIIVHFTLIFDFLLLFYIITFQCRIYESTFLVVLERLTNGNWLE